MRVPPSSASTSVPSTTWSPPGSARGRSPSSSASAEQDRTRIGHRRLGDRPQRLPLRRRRQGGVLRGRRGARSDPSSWRSRDRGPGIDDLPAVLEGRYDSQTGMGLGHRGGAAADGRLPDRLGARRGDARRSWRRRFPRRAGTWTPAPWGASSSACRGSALARASSRSCSTQNGELLRALGEVRQPRAGAPAAQPRAGGHQPRGGGALRRAGRAGGAAPPLECPASASSPPTSATSSGRPLDSMLALSGLLLDRVDGELTEEQEKQVGFIQRSARDLLSRWWTTCWTRRGSRPGRSSCGRERFAGRRALQRAPRDAPSAPHHATRWRWCSKNSDGLPELETDEAKVTQILRNFISNALKFTESGEIRVRAEGARRRRAR